MDKSVWKYSLECSIQALRNEIDPDLPVSLILILLSIPEKGMISFREIEKRTQLSNSACSRSLSLLAGLSKRRLSGGFKLIEYFDDPVDRRQRYAKFTDEGLDTMNRIYSKVNEQTTFIK